MLLIILGCVLILLFPVLLLVFYLTPRSAGWSKGFGGRWSVLETSAFILLFSMAWTRGWLLIGSWIVGLFLLASGVAQVEHFSLPFILLCEGIALLASLLLIWVWFYALPRIRKHTSPTQARDEMPPPAPPHIPTPPHLTTSSAPPALLLHTPYNSSMLAVTIHAYRKRRAFRPIPNRFEPGWKKQGQPETWFVELDCTFRNKAPHEIYVWGQLEEALLDGVQPHVPCTLRQFPRTLNNDDTNDIVLGSSPALAHAKQSMIVKDLVESKIFFKLDKSMNLQKMAFSLHLSSTAQGPYEGQAPLFTIDV